MVKVFIVVLLLVTKFFSVSAMSQENTKQEEISLLKDILPSTCHFTGQFVQEKEITGLPIPISSIGDFFYSCGLGLIWNSSTPVEEVLLFVNANTHFRIDEQGKIEPLSGKVRYGMSRIFLRLLKGDNEYFADEFAVSLLENGVTQLVPESSFMKKGIDSIQIIKNQNTEGGISLKISIFDTTGQATKVSINKIKEYAFDSKQAAFDQCELIYQKPKQWCRMLRSPWRYQD